MIYEKIKFVPDLGHTQGLSMEAIPLLSVVDRGITGLVATSILHPNRGEVGSHYLGHEGLRVQRTKVLRTFTGVSR